MEILELRYSINEMKKAVESTDKRKDHMEKRISELKGRNLEMVQGERERKYLKIKNFYEIYLTLRKSIISIMGSPEGEEREKGAERLFKELIAENFPNLQKELNIQVHEAKRTPNYFNAKWSYPRNYIKIFKIQWQRQNFKDRKKKKKNDNLQRNAHKLSTTTLQDMREWNDIFKILID